jgi:DNA-binding Lrp family transcriptional regulator
MKKLTAEEKKVARIIQIDIPVVARTFQEIGRYCDLSEEEVLKITRSLKQKGYIRRFGAIVHHEKAGYIKNALVIWSVPSEKVEKAGKTMATFSFISHCYARSPAFQDKYSLFTMLHAQDNNLASIVDKLSETIDCHDFLILESLEEYKKISPKYFEND